jgi:endoglucanase
VLSGEPRYLEALHRATQFCLGANPSNLSFTTGLGSEYPRQVLHEDSWKTGQEAPHGITVYGPFDTRAEFARNRQSDWWYGAMKWFDMEDRFTPRFWDWPSPENYVDMWNWVSMNEYTPQQTFAPTAYVWGYMSALSDEP